jgi:hypothetical protein
MNHYSTKVYKDNRCVRRVDSWNVMDARKIYQRLVREFPGALVQIYGPDNKTVPPFDHSIQGFSEGHGSGPPVKRARIEN